MFFQMRFMESIKFFSDGFNKPRHAFFNIDIDKITRQNAYKHLLLSFSDGFYERRNIAKYSFLRQLF